MRGRNTYVFQISAKRRSLFSWRRDLFRNFAFSARLNRQADILSISRLRDKPIDTCRCLEPAPFLFFSASDTSPVSGWLIYLGPSAPEACGFAFCCTARC